jgi:hypothetical protein
VIAASSCSLRGNEHGSQRLPGQSELDAGGHGFVGWHALVFEVLGEVAMQSVEHAHEVRRRQLLDGQEAHVVLADRLEATVHGERVDVDIEP